METRFNMQPDGFQLAEAEQSEIRVRDHRGATPAYRPAYTAASTPAYTRNYNYYYLNTNRPRPTIGYSTRPYAGTYPGGYSSGYVPGYSSYSRYAGTAYVPWYMRYRPGSYGYTGQWYLRDPRAYWRRYSRWWTGADQRYLEPPPVPTYAVAPPPEDVPPMAAPPPPPDASLGLLAAPAAPAAPGASAPPSPGMTPPPAAPPASEFEVPSLPGAPRASQGAAFALARMIPDDPNYRKYIPIDYRLNASDLIGDTARDLRERGEKAHFLVDLAHWGLVAAEIFAEASKLVAGLAILGPLLGFVGMGLAMGMPYVEAFEKIAAEWSARGFSRGVVMGADRRRGSLLRDYFGNDYTQDYPMIGPRGRSIATANYRMGLLVGFVNGRMLSRNQREIFWRDLGQRMGDQSNLGPKEQWRRNEWIAWYLSAASAFARYHLSS